MKKFDIIKITLLSTIIGLFLLVVGVTNREYNYATKVYKVYLNGNELGTIANQNELYNLIDEDQKDIKNTYNVDKVYPPNGFNIEECNSYNEVISPSNAIYEQIKNEEDFTIEGYTVKIKFPEETKKEDIILYVINKDLFVEALTSVVTAFVEEENYAAYINNTQEEIKDVGSIIEKLYFEETITLKPSHISVNEKIYTDANELTQYLLFGAEKQQDSYTVKQGDTIKSIAEDNKLNTSEFLIANPKFKDENSILAIGEKVNINLINPILTLVEELHTVSDEEQVYEKKIEYDSTKPTSFSEVTTPGVTGIVRMTRKVQMVNGEQSQGADPISQVVIRETVNEVTTKGGYRPTVLPPITGGYVDNGLEWGWPTNRPYVITTDYSYRWGSFHSAIDISGTGYSSPIYAAQEGTVVEVFTGCSNIGYYGSMCGNSYGNYVIVAHNNDIYTMYAHVINSIPVKVGDKVSRGQIIAYMGSSGSSTGTHLHFGVSHRQPYTAGFYWVNPWSLYR